MFDPTQPDRFASELSGFRFSTTVGVLVLLAWIAAPLCVGYARFRRTGFH